MLKLIFSCCKIKLKEARAKDDKKFDFRVLSPEMEDDIQLNQLLAEKNWFKGEGAIEMTNGRLHLYRSRLNNISKTSDHLTALQFTTLASYNYRVKNFIDFFF